MNLTHPSIVITTPRNRYARRSEGRYLEQKVTGNPLKLRPRSGYYSAFFPSLQAASLLMQEALRVHGHSFVYQISHVSQSHLTYCHMLFQSAQHPLASIWCLLAASTNLNCHYLHTGLYWKCPKAFTTNTLRGKMGEMVLERKTVGPRMMLHWGHPLKSLRNRAPVQLLVRTALSWAVTGQTLWQ